MAAHPSEIEGGPLDLAAVVVAASVVPTLMLDGDLTLITASRSFSKVFQLNPGGLPGRQLYQLGEGEWGAHQLGRLLRSTAAGYANLEAYEMVLRRMGREARHLVLHAEKLEYSDEGKVRLLLSISDVTDTKARETHNEALLQEKSLLLRETQHRIANSLHIIAGMLLHGARKVGSAEARAHLHDAHHRIMSVASVQKLLSSPTSGDVPMRAYFVGLCEGLGQSMIRDRDKVSITVTADDSSCTAQVATSLGLILTELVINALKHAFPEERQGRISVSYRSDALGWLLSVADDGVGIPAKIQRVTPGLGTGIVHGLARQLGAVVQTEDQGHGATISIGRVSH